MRSVNRVTLLGHLANEVECRQTKTGIQTANFPVATNYVVSGEEKRDVVDFHRVVAFGRLAEICASYLHKGTAVYLEGHLHNYSYEDAKGSRQYRTEIVLDALNILTWHTTRSGEHEVGVAELEEMEETAVAA